MVSYRNPLSSLFGMDLLVRLRASPHPLFHILSQTSVEHHLNVYDSLWVGQSAF